MVQDFLEEKYALTTSHAMTRAITKEATEFAVTALITGGFKIIWTQGAKELALFSSSQAANAIDLTSISAYGIAAMPIGVPVKIASTEILAGLAAAAEVVSLPSGRQSAKTMILIEKIGGTSGGGNSDDFKYKSSHKVWDKVDEKNRPKKYEQKEKVELEKECKKPEWKPRARGGKRRGKQISNIKPPAEITSLMNDDTLSKGERLRQLKVLFREKYNSKFLTEKQYDELLKEFGHMELEMPGCGIRKIDRNFLEHFFEVKMYPIKSGGKINVKVSGFHSVNEKILRNNKSIILKNVVKGKGGAVKADLYYHGFKKEITKGSSQTFLSPRLSPWESLKEFISAVKSFKGEPVIDGSIAFESFADNGAKFRIVAMKNGDGFIASYPVEANFYK